MATVKKNLPEPAPTPPPTYTIELSSKEARALASLLRTGITSGTLQMYGLYDFAAELAKQAGKSILSVNGRVVDNEAWDTFASLHYSTTVQDR
jgi:hypothetical protein